ncbi:MAG: hypothetical protein EAZ89_09145 [Bacteroidetes bacterium]|nr:MAG: hypothetical protein EAZ89_09145 [Bacteroidota bacterium]
MTHKGLIFFALSLLVMACGSSDLSLVNQVKRFEPEWAYVSEKVTFIDRNLRITHRRYDEDLRQVEPLIGRADSLSRPALHKLTSQYQEMARERDDIEKRFEEQKKQFVAQVKEFNDWETRLMKGRISTGSANRQFAEFRTTHQAVKNEMDKLYEELTQNLDRHNALIRQLAEGVNLYTSLAIDYE